MKTVSKPDVSKFIPSNLGIDENLSLFRPKITKFNFKKKKLILVVVEDNEGMEQPTEIKQEHTFVFRYASSVVEG